MILKFKSDADISNVFPLITEDEFDMLKDIEISISTAEYNQILNSKTFKLFDDDTGGRNISIDLFDFQDDMGAVVNPAFDEIKKEVNKQFILSEAVTDILLQGFDMGSNVLLFGRGGHGKSEITQLVLSELKSKGLISTDPYIKALGDGLTVEELFGGINIKKMKDTGELEYLYANSFMNHEVVVLEEIFDAPPQVLLALKDVLTSKLARNGNQTFPLKCKYIIALTNKSKEEFSSDDSLEALTQRFPLELKVEWDSYSKINFIRLFKTVLGESYYEANKLKLITLSDILNLNNDKAISTKFCSPRTAIVAAKLFCKGGDLKYIGDIDPKIADDYFRNLTNDKELNLDEIIYNKFSNVMSTIVTEEDVISNNILNYILDDAKSSGELDLINLALDTNTSESSVKLKETKLSKLKFIQGVLNAHKFNIANKERFKKLIDTVQTNIKTLST